ncbi:DUF647 family protein [Tieghemostelium lacteum]|uniref:DUF647 family protein n=1 Tax=Tieghemostelium lacteum TaxID=361077 RepID=A0A151Z9G1_TIELA|nr:DUF647 family protein [Tieghemostelium lacteum]|eukprot:KYQ90504.1 DUF647 family protein [Tieghemostelium lacteum]
MFLPKGYPHSVTEDYMGYQLWDSAQALCSSVTGVLSTRAILKGYGVGDATATTTSATMQWLIRDGTGMIGRILFVWRKGTELDCNSKTWRFMADILNDVGMTLEIISPYTGYFLTFSCLGIICKSLCGVAGGCTKASLTQHFAKRDNLADVSAKDGSQETFIGLIGLFIAIFVSSIPEDTWTLYRSLLIYQYYIKHEKVPTPDQISEVENILFRQWDLPILLGETAIKICNSNSYYQLNGTENQSLHYPVKYTDTDQKDNYIIWSNTKKLKVLISLSMDSKSKDIIRAYFSSIHYISTNRQSYKLPASFYKELENKGWLVERNLLNCASWRYVI